MDRRSDRRGQERLADDLNLPRYPSGNFLMGFTYTPEPAAAPSPRGSTRIGRLLERVEKYQPPFPPEPPRPQQHRARSMARDFMVPDEEMGDSLFTDDTEGTWPDATFDFPTMSGRNDSISAPLPRNGFDLRELQRGPAAIPDGRGPSSVSAPLPRSINDAAADRQHQQQPGGVSRLPPPADEEDHNYVDPEVGSRGPTGVEDHVDPLGTDLRREPFDASLFPFTAPHENGLIHLGFRAIMDETSSPPVRVHELPIDHEPDVVDRPPLASSNQNVRVTGVLVGGGHEVNHQARSPPSTPRLVPPTGAADVATRAPKNENAAAGVEGTKRQEPRPAAPVSSKLRKEPMQPVDEEQKNPQNKNAQNKNEPGGGTRIMTTFCSFLKLRLFVLLTTASVGFLLFLLLTPVQNLLADFTTYRNLTFWVGQGMITTRDGKLQLQLPDVAARGRLPDPLGEWGFGGEEYYHKGASREQVEAGGPGGAEPSFFQNWSASATVRTFLLYAILLPIDVGVSLRVVVR